MPIWRTWLIATLLPFTLTSWLLLHHAEPGDGQESDPRPGLMVTT